MVKTPERSAEEAAAENIQGKTIDKGRATVPESTTECVEVAERILGVGCRDPQSGERTDRAFVGWEDSPRVYARVHDASIEELRELAQYGFEKHKDGNYLWRNDGPFEVWDHLSDSIGGQGQAWSTDDWEGEERPEDQGRANKDPYQAY